MPLAGDSVVLLTAGGGYVFADCKTGIKLRISKANCKADSLISSQYGALFAVTAEGKLMPASRNILDPCALLAGNRRMSSMHSGSNDNRYLNDDNKAQIVNPMTLRAMKTRGDSGLAIIEALAFGSSTWGVKTKYSKTKWLKRKAKKYMPWVQVLEPTAFVLAEAYFTRMTKHKEAVRPDVIAQLVARSNTRPGSRVVVMDTFHGVVLSAVAELVGPQGKTIFSPSDLQAPMKTVSKADVHSMGQRASLPKVINLKTRNAEAADVIQNCEIAPRLQHFRSKVDALVLASRHEPLSILKTLLPLLRVGGSFVIYSEHIEPLTRVFIWLRVSKAAVNLRLTEVWQREFQVLTSCSHPAMTTSGNAGYILSAMKIPERV